MKNKATDKILTIEEMVGNIEAVDGISTEVNNYLEDGAANVNVRIYYKGGMEGQADTLARAVAVNMRMMGFDDVEMVRLLKTDKFITIAAAVKLEDGVEVRKECECSPYAERSKDVLYINGNRVCELAA